MVCYYCIILRFLNFCIQVIFIYFLASNFLSLRAYLPVIKMGTVLKLSLVFTLLNIGDVATSMIGLSSGKVIECNPLFSGSILYFGIYKFGLCALVFILCWFSWQRLGMEKYRTLSWIIISVLIVLIFFYVFVVSNNIIVLLKVV